MQVSSCSAPGFLETESRQRGLDRVRATLQTLSFGVGHLGFEHLMNAFASNDAWQGKRDSECWVVTADRNYRPLIAQYHLRKSRGNHPYAILAGANTFNDGDVGVTHIAFKFLTHRLWRLALAKKIQYIPAAHSRRGPQEN